MEVTAVLMDTVSIQEYVFGGNRLLDNIGASELLKQAYEEVLDRSLREVAPGYGSISDWRTPEKADDWQDGVKIAYIGGGNAVLLFRDTAKAKGFIKAVSRNLLTKAPGLKTAFGVIDTFDDQDEARYQQSMVKLHHALRINRNSWFPVTALPKQGITMECSRSGSAAEAGQYRHVDGKAVSAATAAKLLAAEQAKERLEQLVCDQIGDCYTFTADLGKFGQQESKSYIAVVHADGNGMGNRFSSCGSMRDSRELSISVDAACVRAFQRLVEYLIRLIKGKRLDPEAFRLKKVNGKTILPIRPIILGGDDITFVCEGRLGVHLAEAFIRFFMDESTRRNLAITVCAGVAVVKTKYPFHKAYTMAEELCAQAKRLSRRQDGSYIDFMISSGGYSGSVEEIRQQHFCGVEGDLCFTPWRVDAAAEVNSLSHLKKGMIRLNDRNKWAKSKVMALREELFSSHEQVKAFLDSHSLELYSFEEFGNSKVWRNIPFADGMQTPYFAMIDLLDFYPASLLKEEPA